MKPYLLFCFTVLYSSLWGQEESTKIITLTYFHGIKMKQLQEPGKPYMFIQLCTTEIDSVISTGNITFEDSKIGKIKKCNYRMEIRKDTLKTIFIETFTPKSTDQALSQATQQFGAPTTVITDDMTDKYIWIIESKSNRFSVELISDKAQKSGTLILTSPPAAFPGTSI